MTQRVAQSLAIEEERAGDLPRGLHDGIGQRDAQAAAVDAGDRVPLFFDELYTAVELFLNRSAGSGDEPVGPFASTGLCSIGRIPALRASWSFCW